jgi:hypothetical protein
MPNHSFLPTLGSPASSVHALHFLAQDYDSTSGLWRNRGFLGSKFDATRVGTGSGITYNSSGGWGSLPALVFSSTNTSYFTLGTSLTYDVGIARSGTSTKLIVAAVIDMDRSLLGTWHFPLFGCAGTAKLGYTFITASYATSWGTQNLTVYQARDEVDNGRGDAQIYPGAGWGVGAYGYTPYPSGYPAIGTWAFPNPAGAAYTPYYYGWNKGTDQYMYGSSPESTFTASTMTFDRVLAWGTTAAKNCRLSELIVTPCYDNAPNTAYYAKKLVDNLKEKYGV